MITRLVSYYTKITLYQTQTSYLWRRPWLCGSWWPTGLGGGGRGPDMHCQCWHRHRTLVPCVLSPRIKWVFVSLQTFGEPLIKTACTLYCDASSRGVSFNEAIAMQICFFFQNHLSSELISFSCSTGLRFYVNVNVNCFQHTHRYTFVMFAFNIYNSTYARYVNLWYEPPAMCDDICGMGLLLTEEVALLCWPRHLINRG